LKIGNLKKFLLCIDFYAKRYYNKSRVSHTCHTQYKGDDFMSPVIVDSAKVMSKGQITLPKDIREALQLTSGDRVTLIYENGQVIMMNSAVYAMQMLNSGMRGEAEKAGLQTEEDINKLVNEIRTEVEN